MLFQEPEEVLGRPKFRDVLGQETTDRFLTGLLTIAEWVADPPGGAVPVTRDPDDEYLLALACSAKVDVLASRAASGRDCRTWRWRYALKVLTDQSICSGVGKPHHLRTGCAWEGHAL
jgi:predicted nucleic acid-binding protein